eukprot:1914482-Pyramimonas_sp.AAC.2
MPQNIEELKERAANGDAAAQSDLGISYAIGDGVTRNLKEAVINFRAAAEQIITTEQVDTFVYLFEPDDIRIYRRDREMQARCTT